MEIKCFFLILATIHQYCEFFKKYDSIVLTVSINKPSTTYYEDVQGAEK